MQSVFDISPDALASCVGISVNGGTSRPADNRTLKMKVRGATTPYLLNILFSDPDYLAGNNSTNIVCGSDEGAWVCFLRMICPPRLDSQMYSAVAAKYLPALMEKFKETDDVLSAATTLLNVISATSVLYRSVY